MSAGLGIFLGILVLGLIGAGCWAWARYSSRQAVREVVSGELVAAGRAALKAEAAKSDDEAAETMRRNLARRKP